MCSKACLRPLKSSWRKKKSNHWGKKLMINVWFSWQLVSNFTFIINPNILSKFLFWKVGKDLMNFKYVISFKVDTVIPESNFSWCTQTFINAHQNKKRCSPKVPNCSMNQVNMHSFKYTVVTSGHFHKNLLTIIKSMP